MGYVKGYHKKDGTWVDSYYTNKPSARRKVTNGKGCVLILLFALPFLSLVFWMFIKF